MTPTREPGRAETVPSQGRAEYVRSGIWTQLIASLGASQIVV